MSGLMHATLDETAGYPEPDPTLHSGRPPGVHCPGCGRFAKRLPTEHYYNGTWNCIRGWTLCSKCGELSEEYV